jgi:hypothetical protein
VYDIATDLTTNATGPTRPPNFELGNGVYYHIETTATFSGDVSVCIDFGGTPLAGTQPTFQHYDSATGIWITPTNISSKQQGQGVWHGQLAVAVCPHEDGRHDAAEGDLQRQPERALAAEPSEAACDGSRESHR